MPFLSIHLLGPPRVERGGGTVTPPRGRKAWALLTYLLCRPGPSTRAHLASLLFEDAEDPLAALRWNLSELRRLLGDAAMPRVEAPLLALPPDACVDIETVTRGAWPQALQLPGLGRDLLEGMFFPNCPAFEVWLATERRRLRAATDALLHEAAQERLAAGAASEAADIASRLVQSNPLDEDFQVLLVRCLAVAGDGIAAARQAAACRELFRRELGITPGPALDEAIHTATARPIAQPATGRAAALAQLEAGEAAVGAGALDAGLHCLRRAIVESDASHDPDLRTRARVALGSALVHAARGRDEEGAEALHEALAVYQEATSVRPALAAAACRELAYVEFLRGRYERALLWLRRAAPLAADDPAEQARIATVQGAALSDTGHYPDAIAVLDQACTLAEGVGDTRQLAYALSMSGRASLLTGELDKAASALQRSLQLAQRAWTAFLPWPQSLCAELDLLRGDVAGAAERFEQAWALGCHLGDPCWEGISGRGLGLVAFARGDTSQAITLLVDALRRCARLPDAYLWGQGYTLDALCSVAMAQNLPHHLPQTTTWLAELRALAEGAGMREFTARALAHQARLGDEASLTVARLLASDIGNPRLDRELEGLQPGVFS
ncbi:BTAD domain-containing putative transcriptional regulator [Hylemonella gracilis]|uniref:SARP family transcriptional regulator n=1 Tax=Hylemonella gracilis ATCC 19624 TaxID=887062 RepID=F3KRZ9_9BURK|nr:BTAD domain-containing putative transcriptional regulator [Hylemonella gracilis]EGI77483.1 SARP family transcriptional regulator [Hylemonella gracilis ATCC 19624]